MATFRPSGISIKIREDLVEGAARTQTTLNVDPIITKDGTRVTMTHIGDICFAKIDQGTSNEEIISFTGITDNTDTYQLTGCVWGYEFHSTTSGVTANKKKHVAGASFIITDDDHFPAIQYVNVDGAQTIGGKKTFSTVPASTAAPVVGDDLVNKTYADLLVLGVLTTINVIVPGKAGETVAAGNLIYFDATDNEWKLTDADTAATVNNVQLGIAQGAGTNGNSITDGVLLQGVDTHQSGLTEGDTQYASNTAGGISTSAGTVEVTVGIAKSATELYFAPRFDQQITEDQQDALDGTSGTPSATNKYVTNDDTATAATANKVARRLAGGNITVITESQGNNSTNAASTAYVDAGLANTAIIDQLVGHHYLIGSALNPTTGGGSITQTTDEIILVTQAGTGGSTYAINSDEDITLAGDFDLLIRFKNTGAAQNAVFVGVGTASGSFDVDGVFVVDHAGFIIGASTLYASNADGTTQTRNSIAAITIANYNYYRVKRVGSSIYFYVNNDLKFTHTTNLPDDTTASLVLWVRNGNGGNGARTLEVYKNYIFVQ